MIFCCIIKSNHLNRISEAPSRLHPVCMVASLSSLLHKGLKLKNEVYQYVVRQNLAWWKKQSSARYTGFYVTTEKQA